MIRKLEKILSSRLQLAFLCVLNMVTSGLFSFALICVICSALNTGNMALGVNLQIKTITFTHSTNNLLKFIRIINLYKTYGNSFFSMIIKKDVMIKDTKDMTATTLRVTIN